MAGHSKEYRVKFEISNFAKGTVKEILRVKPNGEKLWAASKLSTPARDPPGRRVFLVVLRGKVWVFISAGTPMFRYGRTTGPWPNIATNVQAKRQWILLVIEDSGTQPPTADMIRGADYFDFPKDRIFSENRTIRLGEVRRAADTIEAIQDLGRTSLSNDGISAALTDLDSRWDVFDSILWNSQQFSLRLAILVIDDHSYNTHRNTLRSLHNDLWREATNAEETFMVAKHVGCMAGMAVSGLVTFGFGAVAFWGAAGASIERYKYVASRIAFVKQQLDRAFERFGILVQG